MSDEDKNNFETYERITKAELKRLFPKTDDKQFIDNLITDFIRRNRDTENKDELRQAIRSNNYETKINALHKISELEFQKDITSERFYLISFAQWDQRINPDKYSDEWKKSVSKMLNVNKRFKTIIHKRIWDNNIIIGN
jgi:ATP-dependent phosphoenolpyruvate carboxykinase